MKSLKVAGKVTCFDIWNGFLAVGSSAVQLINLDNTSKKVLYMKRERRVAVGLILNA